MPCIYTRHRRHYPFDPQGSSTHPVTCTGCKHVTAAAVRTTLIQLGNALTCGAGYDMEDAMILNKSAVERGLGHATMLKTEQIDLSKESGAATRDSIWSCGLVVHCISPHVMHCTCWPCLHLVH